MLRFCEKHHRRDSNTLKLGNQAIHSSITFDQMISSCFHFRLGIYFLNLQSGISKAIFKNSENLINYMWRIVQIETLKISFEKERSTFHSVYSDEMLYSKPLIFLTERIKSRFQLEGIIYSLFQLL